MKIALVSKTNGCGGGASFFAESLAGWLVEAGHAVAQFCVDPRQELRPWQQPMPVSGWACRVARHANWRARQWGMIEPLPWEYWFGLRSQIEPFDVVHFHDLYLAISPRTLRAVGRRKPVLLTVHDCSAFTGGCLYPLECGRFGDSCGSCPRRAEIGRFDFTRWNLKQMRALAQSESVSYAFPSRWIQDEAARSLLFGGESVHLPNGFDDRPYDYQPRNLAKATLGLNVKKKIVAISSAALDDHRKGARFALQALIANRDLNFQVLVIGRISSALEKALEGLNVTLAGFVTERSRLGLWYAAADLLLFPSLADNLPITIQEAMAAGTPVLAFDVGGVPELVRPGVSGWLVTAGDQTALNHKLREVLESDKTSVYGERARNLMREEFSVAQCVHRHENLYQMILSAQAGQRGDR